MNMSQKEHDVLRSASPETRARYERLVSNLRSSSETINAKDGPPTWVYIATCILDPMATPTVNAAMGACAALRTALDRSEEQLRLANERIEDLCREMALRGKLT